jgi:hypothetical protein
VRADPAGTVKYSTDSFAGSLASSPRAGTSLPSSQPQGAFAEFAEQLQVPEPQSPEVSPAKVPRLAKRFASVRCAHRPPAAKMSTSW